MTRATGNIAISTSRFTRRAAIGGLAFLSVPAAAGAVGLDVPDADPIMPLVRRFAAATDAVRKAENALLDNWGPEDDDAFTALCHEKNEALAALMSAEPTTLAGCAAVLAAMQSFYDEYTGDHPFERWYPTLADPGKTVLGRLALSIARVSR